jgi:hypothetical protein
MIAIHAADAELFQSCHGWFVQEIGDPAVLFRFVVVVPAAIADVKGAFCQGEREPLESRTATATA